MTTIETTFTQLRLHGMNRAWQSLVETRRHHETNLSDGLELLLQAESDDRLNRRTDRYRQQARFRYQATLNELNYDPTRGLDKALLSQLATGEYVDRGGMVLVQVLRDPARAF
jgi:DNA replication protein DnaC